MVLVVEVFGDGTEEQLEQGMELDAAQESPTVPIEEPRPVAPAQPLVKLLQCKPVSPPPKLMLWVDGCLAPALQHPLFIDASAAQALAQPSPRAMRPRATRATSATTAEDSDGEATADEAQQLSPVRATAAAAVRGAVEGLKRERLDAPMGELLEEDVVDAGMDGSDIPCGRSSSVELTPPVALNRRSATAKRTRPASACAATYGASTAAARAAHERRDGLELRDIAAGAASPGGVQGLSDVISEWQLESPSKRPNLLSRAEALSPPVLAAMPPGVTSPAAALGSTTRPAASRPPQARPPTAVPGACMGSSVGSAKAIPATRGAVTTSAAPAAAAPAAAAAAQAMHFRTVTSEAAAAASSSGEPTAPPPSPVLGPRPTPREVFPGLAKRKQRDGPPSMLRVENELDALSIECRPSKLVRCARS